LPFAHTREAFGKRPWSDLSVGYLLQHSLTELYSDFVSYCDRKRWEKQGIRTFDAWAAVFAEKAPDYEFSVTNEIIQKERFRTFI